MRTTSAVGVGLAAWFAAASLAAAAAAAAQQHLQEPAPKCKSCGNDTYGTSIHWEGSAAEAARKAQDEEKLVFVLHVSGHFEDPKFT